MKLQTAKLVVAGMTFGGVLAVGSIAIFLFLPTLRDAQELRRQIVDAQTELEAQYTNRKNLLSSRDKVEETRGIMQALAVQFVPAGRELDFITAVEALAAKNGVTERLQLSRLEEGKKAPEISNRFDLVIDGTYLAALQMLTDLEKLPTLVLLDSLAIRPGGGADGPTTLMITVRGTIAAPPQGIL